MLFETKPIYDIEELYLRKGIYFLKKKPFEAFFWNSYFT